MSKIPENGKFTKRKSIMKQNSFLASNNNLIIMTEPSQPSKNIIGKTTRNSIKYDNFPLKNSEKIHENIKSDSDFIKNDIVLNKNLESSLHITKTDKKLLKILTKNDMDSNYYNKDNASHRKSKSYLEVSSILTKKPSENRILMKKHLEDNDLRKLIENNNKSNNNNISLRKNSREERKISIFASKLNKIETGRNEPKIPINGNARRVVSPH